jgi:hypothetical protein
MRVSSPVLSSVVITAIVCTSVGVAVAGSSGNTLHACASKHGGALRIASKCRRSERAITWSQTGPAGAQGPQGTRGPQGAQGSQGAQGLAGSNGLDGSARAYARVFGAGGGPGSQPSFDAAATKGFTTVNEPLAGHYCLTVPGLDAATTAPVMTPIFNAGASLDAIMVKVAPASQSSLCPSNGFHVVVDRVQLDNSGPSPFIEAVPIGNVSFTIAVP